MEHIDRPWLKAYDPDVPPTLDYEKVPLFKFLDRAAHKWPKRKAIVFKNWSITYAKLKTQSEIVAANLKAAGIRKGDRVALMLPNLPQTIIALWGVLRSGAVGVMTNPLYMETEIVHQFNDAGVRFCITLDLLWPKLEKLRDQIPVERFYVTTIGDGLRFPLNLLYKLQQKKSGSAPQVAYDGKSVFPFKDLTKGGDRFTEAKVDAGDTALLQYTGGTTGVAKGCILTHFNIGANLQQCHAMMHTLGKKRETFLGILPYFHIYGLTVCLAWPTSIGATLAPFPRYVPLDVLKGIDKLKPTVFPGAPSVYVSLLQQKDIDKYDLKSIEVCVSGSGPHARRVHEAVRGALRRGRHLRGLRPDRSLPRNPLQSARGRRQKRLHRPPLPGHRRQGRGHGRGRRAAAPGQARRAGHPGPPGHEGLLQPARRHGRRAAQRLAVHRRHRHHGRGRLLLHRGPQEGPDHLRRVQHLPARDRRAAARPSR